VEHDNVLFLTTGRVNIFDVDGLRTELDVKLKDFKQTDYLLITGPVMINTLAILNILRKFDYVDVLIYHVKLNI